LLYHDFQQPTAALSVFIPYIFIILSSHITFSYKKMFSRERAKWYLLGSKGVGARGMRWGEKEGVRERGE
jgi:hypothetical protein